MPPKGSKKTVAPPKRKAAVREPPPNWPVLRPLVPSTDLILKTLVEGQIITIRNLLTSTLCKNYISFLSSLPLITTPGQPKKGEALRVNDRYQVDDAIFAEKLWTETALRDLVNGRLDGITQDEIPSKRSLDGLWGGQVLGLNPRLRIYRYGKGHFFGQHCR